MLISLCHAQSFWAPGSPSGAGDCVAMSLPSGQWVDMPCGAVLPYVCEEKLYGGSTLVSQVGAHESNALLLAVHC